jgi:hypothetical protein
MDVTTKNGFAFPVDNRNLQEHENAWDKLGVCEKGRSAVPHVV